MTTDSPAPQQEVPARFDVLVAGAGPVGLALGLGLARAGMTVAIIAPEDLAPKGATIDAGAIGDSRAYAVGAATWRIIEALDLAPDQLRPVTPILGMAVCEGRRLRAGSGGPTRSARPGWTGDGPGFLGFDGDEQSGGPGPLGFIVEDRVLRKALLAAAHAEANLTFFAPARLTGASFSTAAAEITLAEGRRLSAPLAIAADGRRSPLRDAAGIRIYGGDYRQTALVATLRHSKPHQGIARQIFLPAGPLALLPLADDRSGLVWTLRADAADAMIKLSDSEFLAELGARIGDCLGVTEIEGARAGFPVGLQIAAELVRPRLALAGDCAHVLHPLAGQGLNLGLRDAAFLLENVIGNDRLGLDIGFAVNLRAYQRARRADIMRHAAVTHGINTLFSNDFRPLQMIRGPGLALAGAFRPARQFFMREAAGDSSCAPALMRGVDLWPRPV